MAYFQPHKIFNGIYHILLLMAMAQEEHHPLTSLVSKHCQEKLLEKTRNNVSKQGRRSLKL
jgi:hypothetical protein